MTLRIEIQEQPERNRYFAEVEIGGLVARRQLVVSERTGHVLVDLETHLAAVRAVLRQMMPELAEAKGRERAEEKDAAVGSPQVSPSLASMPPAPASAPTVREPDDERPEHDKDHDPKDDLDALRAEAEALGVKVDGRWKEARLRQEIEAAGDKKGDDERKKEED